MKEPLFVFGTLRPDTKGTNNAPRFGLTDLGPATLKGFGLWSLGWFPGTFPTGKEEDVLHGRLTEVESHLLSSLDRYEGCPSLNTRVWVKVNEPDVWAWVYQLSKKPGERADLIPSGDWETYLTEERAA